MARRLETLEFAAIAKSPAPVAAVTLETWTAHDWSHGVFLPHLAPHDRLIVRTRNSTYEIVVMVPDIAAVMVRGGVLSRLHSGARGRQLAGGRLPQTARRLRRVSDGTGDRRSADHYDARTIIFCLGDSRLRGHVSRRLAVQVDQHPDETTPGAAATC